MKDLDDVLSGLIEIDYDAIAAYRSAIEKIEAREARETLGEFMRDHERHVTELSEIVRRRGGEPPHQGDFKQVLTQGSVALGGLFGDGAVLRAMKLNEDETNNAYEDALKVEGIPAEILGVLERNLGDERRHRAWIERQIAAR